MGKLPKPADVERATYRSLALNTPFQIPWQWWTDDKLRAAVYRVLVTEGRCGELPNVEIPEPCIHDAGHSGECSWSMSQAQELSHSSVDQEYASAAALDEIAHPSGRSMSCDASPSV